MICGHHELVLFPSTYAHFIFLRCCFSIFQVTKLIKTSDVKKQFFLALFYIDFFFFVFYLFSKEKKTGKAPGEDDIRPEMLKAMNNMVFLG